MAYLSTPPAAKKSERRSRLDASLEELLSLFYLMSQEEKAELLELARELAENQPPPD